MQVFDSVHLKYARWGQRDRACARKEALGGGEAMALSRRGKGDCFQCARGRSHLFTQKVPLLFILGDGRRALKESGFLGCAVG